MRKPIIAGNWKMHKTTEEAADFLHAIENRLPEAEKAETVICPPFIFIERLAGMAKGIGIAIGAQNMHEEESGAFTGEVSAEALKSVGADYVIIGHSERRALYNETDEAVNRKAKAAFSQGLKPIICVGETLEQRENGETMQLVADQVTKALTGLTNEQIAEAVIAYEPIWAIGTGKSSSSEDAQEVCGHIRQTVEELFAPESAESIRIQYGGSVKPGNIAGLMEQKDIDGALVGGASLDPDSFVKLLEAAAHE